MNNRRSRVTTQLLQRRARALKRHLPAAVSGSDRGVHQARVATRRLREAVPVLATGLKHSKFGKARRKIRRLTRALGTVRELDVTTHLLDELTQAGTLPRTALEEVRAHVIAERDRRRAVMLERLDEVNTDKLGRRLASVAEALEKSEDEAWRGVLTTRLLKRSRRLKEAVEAAGPMYSAERLHEVRIAAKKLRYGLELAADSGIKAAPPLLRPIKRTQDILGRLHDLQVLQSHVAAVQTLPAAERPGMHAGLDMLARHIEDKCRHLHGRYLMTAGAIREVCELIRSRVVPEMEKPRARRPLKMALRRKVAAAAAGAR
ncbi:MAG TPA: CHAD domain-containing protein [Vicinamibacterales bacterium]|nr:CHAD domain-containing protein [Vicinamibacterales bacterium]